LAKLLRTDARRKTGAKFNLIAFAAPDQNFVSAHSGFSKKLKKIPVSCETQACAIGLACISGEFKREGFGFNYEINQDGWRKSYVLQPTYRGMTRWKAITKFFGITSEEADRLFLAASYENYIGASAERAVANRICALVRGEEIGAAA
jgi:hypothetical protein